MPDAGHQRSRRVRGSAMTDTGLLTTYTATFVFDRYEDIRAALFDPNLSRSFD